MLTLRSNGTGPSNLISSSWFNDYYYLLTGVMTDQPVTIKPSVTLTPIADSPTIPGSPATTATPTAGTNLGVGTYYYVFTFMAGSGESNYSSYLSVVTTAGNQAVALANIPTGPAGTTARRIYRGVVGSTNPYYLVTTLNDNTTTSYTDTASDATINGNANPPIYSTYGGCLLFKNAAGSTVLNIGSGPSGAILAGNITVYGKTSLDSGYITTDGSGGFYPGAVTFNSGSVVQWRHAIAGPGFSYDGSITCSTAGLMTIVATNLGLKNGSGTKLFEVKTTGNVICSGTQYQTSAGSVSTASGQAFDSFDVAEIYECDNTYANGTVVCPGRHNKLTLCTHDACPCALVISHNPGFAMGVEHDTTQLVALTGRVNSRAHAGIHARSLVTSDGLGGVRALHPHEHAFVLGFALNDAWNGQVGLFLRPCFV